jgi:hypothetical protein
MSTQSSWGAILTKFLSFCVKRQQNGRDWHSPKSLDKLKPQIEVRSNASGLMPPRWL